MRGRRDRWSASIALVLAVLVAGCGEADRAGLTRTTQAPPPTTIDPRIGAPREYVDHPADWVLPGHDYSNSRATFTSSITAANVRDLAVAWETNVDGSLSTVPLIVGDTVYVQDGRGVVFALDRETGVTRWRSAPLGFNIGPFGVAVADGRVFAMSGSKGVAALDAGSGQELWKRDLIATPTTGSDIQPTVFDGMVLAATVPISIGGIYTPGDRGALYALDADTGEVRWSFDTVEGDLWGHPEVNSGGGSWYPPAVDPEQRRVIWGVANPAPFPGTEEFPNGSSRPGPNLYTDSAVALDVDTGELEWFHQVHPHDLFDRDLVHTMRARTSDGNDVVVATGKGGVVVGLDPTSGELRWSTPVGTHENDQLTELSGPTDVWPGTYGGVLTPPATADGVAYVAVVNSPTQLSPDQKAYIGSPLSTTEGDLVAVDVRDGSVRWTAKVPGDPLGGAVVVNDIVLTATLDGTIVAFARDSGAVVWRMKAPGGTNGWMSVAGDTIVFPAGSANPPRIVAYRLPRPTR